MTKKIAAKSRDEAFAGNAGPAPTDAGQRNKQTGKEPAASSTRRRSKRTGGKTIERLEKLSRQEIMDLARELHTSKRRLEAEIRELRQTNTELAESHRRLVEMYDTAPVGCFTFDQAGSILSVNRVGAALLDVSQKKLAGASFALFIQQEDREVFARHIRNVVQASDPDFLECKLGVTNGDGATRFVRLTSSLVRNEADGAAMIRTVLSDITAYKQSEEALRQNRAVLKSIIDATDFMLVYLDPDFNFIWVNPAYAATCRMQPEEMAGRNHFELFSHPENEAIFRRARDTGTSVFFKDKPFVFPDQPERGITYWDWSLVPVKNEAGRVDGLVFSLRETTKYKQAVLDLAESEERFRLMAETCADIIFLLDTEGRLTYCSPAIKSLGYTDEIIGTHLADFVPPDELPQADKALRRIIAGEKISLFELKARKADATLVDLEISASPFVRNGSVVGIQGIARDITARKSIENTLRQSQSQLHTTLENLTEGVIVADLSGSLIYWNPAAVSMHGFSSQEEYLRDLSEFKDTFELTTSAGDIVPTGQWPLFRILRGETIHNCELKIHRRDLNWHRFYSYGGTLARDDNGQPLLAILTLRDISERKAGEEKIRLRNALLKGINNIFQAGLECDTEEELARAALDITAEITGSRCGLIAEIGYNGLLHNIAVSNPREKNDSIPEPQQQQDSPEELIPPALYTRILQNGAPLYINDLSSYSAGITVPGWLPLSSFLGAPLLHDGRTIGIIGMANRDGGYRNEDVHSIASLAQVFIETLVKLRTRRALQSSEARERQHAAEMAQLLNFTPIPIWIAHDPQCQMITSNLAAVNLTETQSGRSDVRFAGPELHHGMNARFLKNGIELTPEAMPLQQAVARGAKVEDMELDIVLQNGEVKSLLGEAVPLFDSEGMVKGAIAAYMDITERKWIEEQLRRVKDEWEKTFDSVPDLIAILDNQHRIIRANRAMADRLGLTPGQCVSRKCFSCVHDQSAPPANCPHVLTLKDGREHVAEVYEERLNGYFLVSTTPIYDENGKMLGSVHVSRDITEQKRSEKLLQESERRLKKTQDMAHLGSWELDLENNILTWSDEIYRILGMEPRQQRPCYEDFLSLVHPEDREKVRGSYMHSLLTDKATFETEHRIIQISTGRIRYVHEKCEHIRDLNGKVIRSVGMMHDITERRAAEEKIRHLNRELQASIIKLEEVNRELARSNEDLQQFANIISHDLQEPLRTISSFLQLISRRYAGRLDEKANTFINQTVEGASYMQQQLRDLLAFSRVGGGSLRLQPVALRALVDDLIMNLKTAIEEHKAEIQIDDLPVVHADKTQLNHLLQNLVANALKFRGEASPRIHIFSRKEKDNWVVCVRDNGIGIDPRHADRIFLIFQRLHRRNEYEGTGVGLAICKKIVERHGGRIWVQSEPARGSLFCFTLPDMGRAPEEKPAG
jgi:PAS domain S-box-containing protein